MSKYTTEVRFICEQKAGLTGSKGFADVNAIINEAWNKIFTTNVEFFDPDYKPVICKKILKNYYLREICAETIGVWQLWLNTRLENIMPYYNQLYKSALIEFNPMYDVDLQRSHDTGVEGKKNAKSTTTTNETGENSSSENGNYEDHSNKIESGTEGSTGSGDYKDNTNTQRRISETPQGSLDLLDDATYLTRAEIDGTIATGDYTNKQDISSSRNSNEDKDGNTEKSTSASHKIDTTSGSENGEEYSSTENYIEKVIGKQGSSSYSKMLTEFRETFLNIDMMIINEFHDLFMGVW